MQYYFIEMHRAVALFFCLIILAEFSSYNACSPTPPCGRGFRKSFKKFVKNYVKNEAIKYAVNTAICASVGRLIPVEDSDDNEYLDFMNQLDWDSLKSQNVSLNISGDKFAISKDFFTQMQIAHTE